MRLSLARAEHGTVWVARDESEVIGIIVAHDSEDERYVGDLFVEPSYREQGIGPMLLEAALGDGREVTRTMLVDPHDPASLALAFRYRMGTVDSIVRFSGAIPREEELAKMAAGEYRFQVEAIDPVTHAFALSELDRQTRGTARRSRPRAVRAYRSRSGVLLKWRVRRLRICLAGRAHRPAGMRLGSLPRANLRLCAGDAAAKSFCLVVHDVGSRLESAHRAGGASCGTADSRNVPTCRRFASREHGNVCWVPSAASLRQKDFPNTVAVCSTVGTLLSHNVHVKRCPRCACWLPRESFASRGVGKGLTSYCRGCQNAYSQAHYRLHVGLHNRRRYRNMKQYRRRNAEYMRQYLSDKSCVNCGEADLRVLEFDHVRDTKLASIAELSGRGVSWRRIEVEIAKCEIRCANCHRRKTVNQFGWWRGNGA